ncbi:hypothetical protein C0J52_06236 [Blattella germanica]|nr:hypothetical protein C0J52_06236 [Blattella germanica]
MADRGRLTIQHRAKTVLLYAETKSVVLTQRCFHQHFNTRWAPAKNTIYRLYRQFETNGMPEPKQPRVSQIRSPENIDAMRVAMQSSPGKSTRIAAAQLGISRRSIQLVLHSVFHLFPYKMTVLHTLLDQHKEERPECRRVV